MKRTILVIFILLFYFSNFAQPYKPCLDGEIVRWSFIAYHTSASQFQSADVVAFGDTVLNDFTYRKLYIDSDCPYNSDLGIEENNTNWKNYEPRLYHLWENVFIRENEDASKLYIYLSQWNEEHLISDISLQEGDIFNIYSYGQCESIVDSVYFENGLKHIRWHNLYNSETCSIENKYTFTEAVGSDVWFIYHALFSQCLGLNCFQNQTTFYKNNRKINNMNFSNFPCGYISNWFGINSISEDNYCIFVQRELIEVFSPSNINADISLYDMQGKLYYSKNIISDNRFNIITSSLPKGTYILSILSKINNQTHSKKIVLY